MKKVKSSSKSPCSKHMYPPSDSSNGILSWLYRVLFFFFLRLRYLFGTRIWERTISLEDSPCTNIDEEKALLQDNEVKAKYTIGFDGWPVKTKPAHETMALAALFAAGLPIPNDATYHTASSEVWEIFRGNIWNDDPACALFDNGSEESNKIFSWPPGAAWYKDFSWAEAFGSSRTGSIIGRSHFGDLQFLHAMSCYEGEPAKETRDKIILWCEIMYKLAVGEELIGYEKINDIKIERGGWRISSFFAEDTNPQGDNTLAYLLTKDTNYKDLNIRYRALGSLMHIIQDSYAKGHTRRTFLSEPSRIWDRLGKVKTFHCYHGQNGTEHRSYDTIDTDLIRITNLEDFNVYWGARSAVEGCICIVKLWMSNKPWKEGPLGLLEDIFALAPDSTSGDSSI
ncbi:hypothetical protein H072_1493 [Dactylellina haptotyla CBS 200.50]|uniref:Uncharacterized protein n=1 Tax=Dactylellina haptotyla (strain CBS 200.50) TaxID=1284197 RepID=S8ANJ0_DACHA|nr:hypothetical protein H072_1493 [Dactylellina haptotyla CBS 200.50]